MFRALVAALLLVGCASPAMSPNLSLHDRFVLTALTHDDGRPVERLRRWRGPIRLYYDGPEEFREAVYRQAVKLGAIAGEPVDWAPYPERNLFVEISDRDTPNDCQFTMFGPPTRYDGDVHIWSELSPAHIHQCIAQEMAHALGPSGDLDGPLGSRSDSVFASYQTATELTSQDLAVLRILFDPRLRPGMPRDEVLEILPAIVADVEAEQATGR